MIASLRRMVAADDATAKVDADATNGNNWVLLIMLFMMMKTITTAAYAANVPKN